MTRILISVGCNNYTLLSHLYGAEQDAKNIFALLTNNQFGNYDLQKSRLLLSPNIQQLKNELNESLFTTLSIDVLTFFFAGHGGIKNGYYYLYLLDTDETKLSITAFPMIDLLNIFTEVNPKQLNIIIDSCESAGTIYDLGNILKPDILGTANSLSIAFLAACASNQYASEENQAGVLTTALIKYLNGGRQLQNTRQYLDLVELGRAVSTDVKTNNLDQIPVTGGLNLYGPGKFALNPFFSSQEIPLLINTIPPNSLFGRTIQQSSEKLWDEYSKILVEPNYINILQILQKILLNFTGNIEDVFSFIHGVMTSFSVRAGKSRDLLAETNLTSCCIIALIPFCEKAETQTFIAQLIKERSLYDKQSIDLLKQSLILDCSSLINSENLLSDLYYLPIRLSKILGWLGASLLIDKLLNIEDKSKIIAIQQLLILIVEIYKPSLTTISDEQSPYIYIFSKACELYRWYDLSKAVLDLYFTNLIAIKGAVAKIGLRESQPFQYTYARSTGTLKDNFEVVATPSQLIASLLLSGVHYELPKTWDYNFISLDHKALNIFLPDNYLEFGMPYIPTGRNYTYTIGHEIWTVKDLINEFNNFCIPNLKNNTSIQNTYLQVACILAAYLLPNRVPYFLELMK